MNKETLKELRSSLKKVLFNDWSPSQSEKANHIISLCNYYNIGNLDTEVNSELKKLNENLLDYELLEKLTRNLNSLTDKDFRWEPRFHREEMPQNISLSPTFNIGIIDVSGIITEIENIRNAINNRSVNLNILISFISKRVEETGDLNKEIEENK